jgi:hypothetical protein
MKAIVIGACALSGVSAGSIEIVSSDLASPTRGIDTIKGKWSQALNVLGRSAVLSAEYDRASRRDFLTEATLSGDSGNIKYELTTKFDGSTECKLATTTSDGTTLEAEGDVNPWYGSGKVSKLTASRSVNVRGQDCEIELAHHMSSRTSGPESKLTVSSALGSGIKAIGLLNSKGGDSSLAYEVEYDTSLNEGRTLSAKVRPFEGTGKVEYTDSSTLDATLTATFPLGEAPKVTLKRSFGF